MSFPWKKKTTTYLNVAYPQNSCETHVLFMMLFFSLFSNYLYINVDENEEVQNPFIAMNIGIKFDYMHV